MIALYPDPATTKTPTHPLLRPLTIGGLRITAPLTLAPMAGQTNYAFRVLCREVSPDAVGLVCTELISSQAMQFKGSREKTFQRYFDWRQSESPFAVQLFGADPRIMAEAAKMVADHGADIVDINMGCWVPKVAKNGAGAALLKDVCTATAVVEAVVNAVSVPVTVKVRAGFTRDNPTAVPFARAAQAAGVAAIAVHWRFAEDGFNGDVPDWSPIAAVKAAVSIPVIGNGDVKNAEDARRMIAETGCDAVMIGRAALGNPWVFAQIAHELATGEPAPAATPQQRGQMCLRHAELTMQTTQLPHEAAIRELRGQLIKYTTGLPDATTIRHDLVRAETLREIAAALRPLL